MHPINYVMETRQELIAIQKSLKKARRVCEKLEKKQHRVHVKICESEKEKARRDRITFVRNIQVSKVPCLLKRRLPVDDDEDSTALRDYTFGISDVFTQITQHLGPMEYFMFSRTSKSIDFLLKDSFAVWARLFMECIRPDAPRSMLYRHEERLMSLVEQFEKIKHRQTKYRAVLPMLLSLWQQAFVQYRAHTALTPDIERYVASPWQIDKLCLAHLFVENGETREISRASEHNLLFSSHSSKEIGRITERNFREKYNLDLIKKDDKTSVFDYFRYDDLNALNLNRASDGKKCSHGVFMIDPVDEEIRELTQDKQFHIYILDTPDKKRFCDEYECYSTIRATEPFIPNYPSIHDVTLVMSALLSK